MNTAFRKTISLIAASFILSLPLNPALAQTASANPTPTHQVRERLMRMTAQLEALHFSTQAGKRPLNRADLNAYLRIKPWGMWFHSEESPRPERQFAQGSYAVGAHEVWPQMQDGEALRTLLSDAQPAVRALAVDALATLNQIDDIPRIAALLADASPASASSPVAPSLEFLQQNWVQEPSASLLHAIRLQANPYNFTHNYQASYVDFRPATEGEPIRLQWARPTVAQAASGALVALTQEQRLEGITKDGFAKWWQRNSDAKNSLWYWKKTINADPKARLALLRSESPELEAKVRLLHPDNTPLFGDKNALRLSEARLMQLLENPSEWEEVEKSVWAPGWSSWGDNTVYLVTKGITEQGSPIFKPHNAARLKALLNNPAFAHVRHYLFVAFSRSQSTVAQRDAVLRSAMQDLNYFGKLNKFQNYDLSNAVTQELVRASLPAQQGFLLDLFFDGPSMPDPDHTQKQAWETYQKTLAQALVQAPRTAAHRQFVNEWLQHPKLLPLLKKQDARRLWLASALEALSLQNGLEPGYFGKNPGAQIYIHLTKPDTAEQGLAKLSELIETLKNAKP